MTGSLLHTRIFKPMRQLFPLRVLALPFANERSQGAEVRSCRVISLHSLERHRDSVQDERKGDEPFHGRPPWVSGTICSQALSPTQVNVAQPPAQTSSRRTPPSQFSRFEPCRDLFRPWSYVFPYAWE